MAKRSVLMASVFGFIALIVVVITGDGSAYQVAQKQPMKLAAMEGLYEGRQGAGLVAVGVLKPRVQPLDSGEAFLFKMEVPRLLSWLGYHDTEAFVPGVNDVLRGGYQYDTPDGETVVEPSVEEKISMGRKAIEALRDFTDYRMQGDTAGMEEARERLEANFRYFGYGYLNSPESVVPNVPLTFYAFHTMVALGGLFFVFFAVVLYLSLRDRIAKRWLLITSIIMVPLVYLCSQAGWVVAEVGRQPWTIQDILPTMAAVSRIDAGAVQVTFCIFAILFTVLLVAELSIMFRQIKLGPRDN